MEVLARFQVEWRPLADPSPALWLALILASARSTQQNSE